MSDKTPEQLFKDITGVEVDSQALHQDIIADDEGMSVMLDNVMIARILAIFEGFNNRGTRIEELQEQLGWRKHARCVYCHSTDYILLPNDGWKCHGCGRILLKDEIEPLL